MKPLAPNTLLQNRYLLVQLIGKGGMGEVYLAVDQRLGSAIALKRTYFSDDKTLVNAFEREARTLARLRHPVLPKVSDHFSEDDTQYLVMEHISGDDLAKRLEDAKKPFPLNLVLLWADELLDALAYLHTHGPPIVHRDIKPQNLKLTDENHIVLLDFGLAKNSKGQVGVSSGSGSIVGYTPHYAPMEQIRGTGTNAKTDIYSLSATLYQLLTYKVPPDALTRADVMLNNLPDPTVPISQLNPEVPEEISKVILKGMSLNSEHRYATAREMQKALHDAYTQTQNSLSVQTLLFDAPTEANKKLSSKPKTQAESFSDPTVIQTPISNTTPAPNETALLESKTKTLPPEKMAQAENLSTPIRPDKFIENEISSGTEANSAAGEIVTLKRQGGKAPSSAVFDLPSEVGENFAPANTSVEPESVYKTTPQAFPQIHSPAAMAPKKKSGGKSIAIAGGIGALAIAALGSAAIGWYALRPAETTNTAPPAPQPTVSTAPPVEPTVEANVPAITNANVSSEGVAASEPAANTNTSVQQAETSAAKTRTENERPVQSTSQRAATPKPQVATVAPSAVKNKPNKPPVQAKPPAASRRTDILQ